MFHPAAINWSTKRVSFPSWKKSPKINDVIVIVKKKKIKITISGAQSSIFLIFPGEITVKIN